MKRNELADLILRVLQGHTSPKGVAALLERHGVTDRYAIEQAVADLKEQGLVSIFCHSSESGSYATIGPKASRAIEEIGEGESILDHLHRQQTAAQAVSITFHGDIKRSPIMIASPGARQKTEMATDEGPLVKLWKWSKKAIFAKLWGWAMKSFGGGGSVGK